MTVASCTAHIAAIASPPIAARAFGQFNAWWRSMDPAKRRRVVETERKLRGAVPFESGLPTDFLAGNYGRKRGDA